MFGGLQERCLLKRMHVISKVNYFLLRSPLMISIPYCPSFDMRNLPGGIHNVGPRKQQCVKTIESARYAE
jgi:hypothetical protein